MTVTNVCDLSSIYREGFSYPVPQATLQDWILGRGFPDSSEYTPAEQQRLQDDINAQCQKVVSPLLCQGHPFALITAGVSGSGKTRLLEEQHALVLQGGFVLPYTDPNAVCSEIGMPTTYQQELCAAGDGVESQQAVYNKWRAGSNALAHLTLANWVREKISFSFGTTSAEATTDQFFKFLKDQGYQIYLIHVTAPDEVCWDAVQERDKAFVKTTREEIEKEGRLLPQRIMDTYLKYADRIDFYYRGAASENATLAAIWSRTSAGNELIHIKDPDVYERIKSIHNAAVAALGKLELNWERTVGRSTEVVEGGLVEVFRRRSPSQAVVGQ